MRKWETKQEKEQEILRRIKYLHELDDGYKGYLYISELFDIIAQVAFGCDHEHNYIGATIYPSNQDEFFKLYQKISMVISNMVKNGVITVSKSKKMFKLNKKD